MEILRQVWRSFNVESLPKKIRKTLISTEFHCRMCDCVFKIHKLNKIIQDDKPSMDGMRCHCAILCPNPTCGAKVRVWVHEPLYLGPTLL